MQKKRFSTFIIIYLEYLTDINYMNTTTNNPKITSAPSSYARIIQNFVLVWLDKNIEEINNSNYRETITKLRQVVIDSN